MKIDWKKKLTSRKLWIAVVGFVTPLLLAFGMAESEVTQIASIIMAGATMISYIIGEGMIDASYNNTDADAAPYTTDAIGFTVDSSEEGEE